MQNMKCPTCGTENDPNAAFCDQCGASLARPTPPPASAKPAGDVTPPPFPPPPERIGIPLAPCRLEIGGKTLTVPLKKEAVIGRAESTGTWKPDVDLGPFGGKSDAGVSRKHAKIVWQGGWMIEDLNSTNGTYLRGQRLPPNQRTLLNNGDALLIGKVEVKFLAQ
ncbi:MAG: FHA domain-containing protein [Chloroflexi bacterium]|nr:FHA domain-containing protein [Chloroflexota bacterium]